MADILNLAQTNSKAFFTEEACLKGGREEACLKGGREKEQQNLTAKVQRATFCISERSGYSMSRANCCLA